MSSMTGSAVAASRSEGLWAGTVRAVHTARLGRSHEKKKGKIFHEISSMWCKQIQNHTHGTGVWSLGQDGRRAYAELGTCGGSHAD